MLPAELGGDDHFATERFKGFTHQLLVGEWSVDFRRIEKRDATLDRLVHERDHLLFVGRRVAKTHPHTAQPEGRYFKTAASKLTFFHFLSFYSSWILACPLANI